MKVEFIKLIRNKAVWTSSIMWIMLSYTMIISGTSFPDHQILNFFDGTRDPAHIAHFMFSTVNAYASAIFLVVMILLDQYSEKGLYSNHRLKFIEIPQSTILMNKIAAIFLLATTVYFVNYLVYFIVIDLRFDVKMHSGWLLMVILSSKYLLFSALLIVQLVLLSYLLKPRFFYLTLIILVLLILSASPFTAYKSPLKWYVDSLTFFSNTKLLTVSDIFVFNLRLKAMIISAALLAAIYYVKNATINR